MGLLPGKVPPERRGFPSGFPESSEFLESSPLDEREPDRDTREATPGRGGRRLPANGYQLRLDHLNLRLVMAPPVDVITMLEFREG